MTRARQRRRCVFLDKVYSLGMLHELARAGIYAIGFGGGLGAENVVEFCARFYAELGDGMDIERTFERARRSLALAGDYSDSPTLVRPCS